MAEINQQVIADRLGISRATISRCFTNHAGISPLTRAKVFQVAAELGYTHMEARTASGELTKKKLNFSVLICSETDEYFRGGYQSPGEQILAGVSENAQRPGVRLDVHLIPPEAQSLDFQVGHVGHQWKTAQPIGETVRASRLVFHSEAISLQLHNPPYPRL